LSDSGSSSRTGDSKRYLYALMFLVTLLWSFNFITAKIALRQWPPVLLTGCRTVLALVICLPLYWREHPLDWTWSLFFRYLGLGSLGMALNQLFFAIGVKQTSVAHGALIVGMTPIFVTFLSAAIGQETFRPRKLIGMGVALAGIGVLQWNSTGKGSQASFLGDCLVLLGCLCFTLFTVFSKPLSGRLSIVGTVTLNYLGASIVLAPATYSVAAGFVWSDLLPISWLCLFFMAAVPSVLCFLLYYRVLRGLSASKLSAFTYLQPLLASSMAIPLLGETLTANLLGGGLMILLGVWLTEKF
jgi:drug/metabolite transporter (DMT)-like permease